MSVLLATTAGAVGADVARRLADRAADAGQNLISNVGKAALTGNPIQSLADVAKAARVEPLALIDKTLEGQPYTEDVVKMALSTFTAYYLQAASILVNINRIEVMRVLDSMNPERGGVFGGVRRGVSDAVWSRESYEHGLPSLESFDAPIDPRLILSIEEQKDDRGNKKPMLLSEGVDGDTVKRLYEVENLAVGKMINVEFKEGNDTVKIPVVIRLVPTFLQPRVLAHIFTAVSKNTTWKERWHLWRSGQIRFVRDLMFSMDIVDEHRKALINDTSNVYMTISDRRRKNSMKAYATATPSMADASNIAVITKETAKLVSREIGGKLDNLATRKKIFDASYLILLVVVDEEWERVTIYHRGFDRPTELSFKEIKSAEKGKGPDLTEILKAYQIGSSPSI